MKSNQINPLKDRVLIKPEAEVSKAGLIEIPESYRAKSQIGKVISVGPNNKDVKPGDRVAFALYGGFKFETEDKGLLELLDSNLVWVVLE